jgi:7-carboxy-7-deazaguanine synthase
VGALSVKAQTGPGALEPRNALREAGTGTRVRTHAVMEVFGPTVQGEGPDAGRPTLFVRFGGCDYRCSWCDSMFAVEPASVRANAERLTDEQIVRVLQTYSTTPGMMVVLSGGNPALQHLERLVPMLHEAGYRVAVETQGTVWRDWLGDVDSLIVSPKPPSSGMDSPEAMVKLDAFLDRATVAWRSNPTGRPSTLALKVVVFDDRDFTWAVGLHLMFPHLPFYLSVGTDRPDDGESYGSTLLGVAERWKWLAEKVAGERTLVDAVVLPQLHVIAWGHAQGV